MSFRVSFILLVLVAVVGGYVLLFELQKTPKAAENAPWLFAVGMEEFAIISLEHTGQKQVFENTPDGWVFLDTRQAVNPERWGGIPLLLTGPRSTRVAKAQIDNPADYGLDPPQSVFTVMLKRGQSITTLLGNKTPDGQNHYGQVIGSAPLFLIPASWGNVINEIVDNPPFPPTPTPTPNTTGITIIATATPTAAPTGTPAVTPAP